MATTHERIEEATGLLTPGGGELHRSLRQDVWRQFKKHKGAVVGLVLLGLIVFATIFGPMLYGIDPYAVDTSITNAPASPDHVLGTDNLGRDVLARVLVGGRISLAVGFAAMLFGLVLGSGIGILSGYFRKLDGPLMRVTDLFLALPILPLLLVIIMLWREPLKATWCLSSA
jgi:peptide/nickel transport system permease protein